MPDDKPQAESSVILRLVLCVFLGVCLYLYITNNSLFSSGAYNWQHPETFVMLAVFGVPFGLAVLHLVRSQRRAQPQGGEVR